MVETPRSSNEDSVSDKEYRGIVSDVVGIAEKDCTIHQQGNIDTGFTFLS